MDTLKLGCELARAVIEMTEESYDDILATLPSRSVLLEYTALLLWIVAKKASVVLPKESIQSTIDHAHNAIFYFLDDAGFPKIRMLGGHFNAKTFEDWMANRFKIYYGAWEGYGPTFMAELEAEGGKEAVQELREINVAHNFVIMCLTDEVDGHKAQAEYEERYPPDQYYAQHVGCVLNHYRRFSERVKSLLSRSYDRGAGIETSLRGKSLGN